MTIRRSIALPSLILSLAGCAAGPDLPAGGDELDLRSGRPLRVQPGARLFVLGVTDDDHVIFQDGTRIYASALAPDAPRELIAETGADIGEGNPMVFTSGDVAFVWPDAPFFGLAVSRLFVWTAAGGARLATGASLPSAGAAAASPDSRQIIYLANVSDDGTVGDVVTSRPDLGHALTLVAGAASFPSGACAPLLGFDRKARLGDDDDDRDGDDGDEAHPVAGYCPAASTTPILSRWVHGRRHDLASDVHGFPLWSTDTKGRTLFTLVGSPRANQRPVAIDRRDRLAQLDDVFTGGGTINSDDTIMTFARPATNFEMRRFTGRPPRPSLVTDMGTAFNIFFNVFPRFVRDYSTGFTSGAGLALFANATAHGRNLFAVDTTRAPATRVPLQQDAACGPSVEPFSADSRHVLVYCSDPDTVVALFDDDPVSGAIRRVSSGSAEDGLNFAVDRGTITFADALTHTPEDGDLGATVDIELVDLAAAELAPRTLVEQAYSFYFPTRDRRRIVYSHDRDPAAQGIFVQRVR